jgi:hypothetical protein
MKQKITFYYLTITMLLLSNFSFGQTNENHKINDRNNYKKIVEELNQPTQIWNNGYWVIKHDGSREWKKGYWKFKQKSFQEKSILFKRKMAEKNKV